MDARYYVDRINQFIVASNWYKEVANFLLRQGFTRSRKSYCFFARAATDGHIYIFFGVDNIIVSSRSMTVISDVKKALEATIHMKDRVKQRWFLVSRIRQEEGKVTDDQERTLHRDDSWAVSNGSMQNLKKSSQFEFKISDSTERRRRSGSKDLMKFGWITSSSDQTEEARHDVHSQHSVQTH